MVKEYRVGTNCGVPAILCNGVPISLDEVAMVLNSTDTKTQNTVPASDRYPVYFVKAGCDGSEYTCIILCTNSDVFDRSVEKIVVKNIKKEHTIPGKLFVNACSLLGYTTIDDARKRGLIIA